MHKRSNRDLVQPEGYLMYAAIRQGKAKTAMAEELARRIKEGAIPIISDVEGFMAYYVVYAPDDTVTPVPVASLTGLTTEAESRNLLSYEGSVQPSLVRVVRGAPVTGREQADRFGDIAAEHGCGEFEWATKPEDRTRLWQARHDAHWSVRALRPGANSISTDVCVPISRLAECVEETQRDIADMGLLAPIVGH